MEDSQPGTRLDDFTIAYRISRGMNADVFAIWHHALLAPLVCKRLRPEESENRKWRGLLRREGEALARLTHPGIVRLIEQNHRCALPYLLLEHVGELTLRDRLKEEGALEIGQAIRLVQHVGGAVAHAHDRGFLHRDLKPSNVVLRDGRPVLIDFGVVWKWQPARRPPDRSGTPQYLAPEQIEREPLNPATDIYGLGVLLYELLTGTRPFRPGVEDRTGTLAARYPQLNERPAPLSGHGREIPAGLAEVIYRCLSKRPAERYQRVRDLLGALDPFIRDTVWPEGAAAGGRSFDPFA